MSKEGRRRLVTPQISADLPVEPEKEASFQFNAYANTLARIISDPATETPLTVGISGQWGTGKTTLMRALRARLDQTRDVEKKLPEFANSLEEAKNLRVCKTVWFNAWKYSRQEEIFVALIEEILREMRHDGFINKLYASLNDPKEPEVRLPEAVLSTLTRVISAGQIDIDLTSFYKDSRFSQNLAFLDEFQVFFDRLLKRYLGRDKKGDTKGVLVVFVDDLDRCLPDKTVQVLETVKLFMDKPSCAFILGADAEVIQSAIEARYKTKSIEGVTARDYLDKIVQLRFEIPPVRQTDMETFVRGLQLRDQTLLSSLEIISGGVRTNPRRVKTFINYLELQWALLVNSGQGEDIRREDFIQWLVLTEAGPEFCANVRNLPKGERVEYILGAAKVAQGDKDDVLVERHGKWLERYPRLRQLLALKGLSFEVEPDTLDRFIFLSAPPVEVMRTPPQGKARPMAQRRAAGDAGEGRMMVSVPAGPFHMGSTRDNEHASSDERPQHKSELGAFLIGRHLVTNRQYAGFVEAGGYGNRDYWTDAGWAWRQEEKVTVLEYPDEPAMKQADQPVVGVSWYEALAYCRWLSESSRRQFRLPTEAEWEKAARGEHAREWPWGNEFDSKKANTYEGGPGRTSAVGSYSPEGDSPYGAADMAGNVWEWCSTLYRGYPYRPDDGREDLEAEGGRLLRGGSWHGHSADARCAFRHGGHPELRSGAVGFRVAAFPSSP